MKKIIIKPFGTSHSVCCGAQILNLPQNFKINAAEVERELFRRRVCFGRSERQNRENDKVYFIRGITPAGQTRGKIKFLVENVMRTDVLAMPPITALRPNHADLAAAAKYGADNTRMAIEYTGGRSTVAYTVAGALCRQILFQKCGAKIYSRVLSVGQARSQSPDGCSPDELDDALRAEILQAQQAGDSLGGEVKIVCKNFPAGVGGFFPYGQKLSAEIAAALCAIPSVKSLEFGEGKEMCKLRGTQAADVLALENGKIVYKTNNCGGLCGGVSNGADISVTLGVKPVPTTAAPQSTIDIKTLEKTVAHSERADTCVAPAVAVIAENMLAAALLNALLTNFK